MPYLYKPVSSKAGKGVVVLVPHGTNGTPTITDPATGKVYTGRFVNDVEGNKQYEFSTELRALKNLKFDYGGESFNLESGGQAYEGSSISGLQARDKGSVGDSGQFTPGTTPNGLGAIPANVLGDFPSPTFSQYTPIKAAPYQYTDPLKFAESFGNFNRSELTKNYDLSKGIALDTLDTELAALKGFVPAASALKRGETSIDNLFNQFERTQQVDQTLPNLRPDLEAQRERADTYASGKVPGSIEDRAFEVSSRSAAADAAGAGGFGASSSAARKASDLMSVQDRIKLSQYGDQLLGQNQTQSANLLLAPTEYSNAGSQINVNPSVSPAQLISQEFGNINQNTLVSPGQALQTEVGEQQFKTNLEQSTRTFNAANTLQNNQFNAGVDNTFKLSKFNYEAAYANSVAGATQVGINAQVALDQQKQYQDIFSNYLKQAQSSQQISAIAGLVTTLFGSGAATGVVNAINGWLGGGTNTGNATQPTTPPSQGPGEIVVPPGTDAPSGYVPVGTDSSGGTIYAPGNTDTGTPTYPGQTDTGVTSPTEPQPPPQPPETFNTGDNGDFNTQAAHLSPELRSQISNFTKDLNIPITTFSGKTPAQIQSLSQASKALLQSTGISNTQAPGMVQAGVDNNGNPIYVSQALQQSNNPQAGSGVTDALKTALDPTGVLTRKDASTLSQIGAVASDVGFLANLDTALKNGDKKGFTNMLLNRLGYPATQSLVKDPGNKAGVAAAFNAYNLYENWNRMSPTQKAIGVANLGIQGFKFASGYDLGAQPIISAVKDAAGNVTTPGINVGQALNLLGTGYNVYNLIHNWNDYSTIQKVAGGVGDAAAIAGVAKEFGLLGDKSSLAKYAGEAGGVAGIALGAQSVIKGWGKGGTSGAVGGALGGASIVGGLSLLGYSNPYTAAAIIATSVLGDTIKVGKSKAQGERDSVRSNFKSNGLIGDDYKVSLPDGTVSDIGIDGHGGQHDVRDPSLLVGDKPKKLNAWDIDYTNAMDYTSGMAGITLSRFINGGKGTSVDQLGNQLGNAGLGKVGFGKDMTEANFNSVMQNQRAMYAKAGIKSKADGYALTQQMVKDGRISQIDAVQMQQSLNMMYDPNGFNTAQKLMNGRLRGAEVAHQNAGKPKATIPITDTSGNAANPSQAPGVAGSNVPVTGGKVSGTINTSKPFRVNTSVANLSKVDAAARNRAKYGNNFSSGYL